MHEDRRRRQRGGEFCRMLPYDGTPIKDRLAARGSATRRRRATRLRLPRPAPQAFYRRVNELSTWPAGSTATRASPKLNWAWNELAVLDRLFPALQGRQAYEGALRAITRASNELLFRLVLDITAAHEDGKGHRWTSERLAGPCDRLLERLAVARDGFVTRNQEALLGTLRSQGLAVAA